MDLTSKLAKSYESVISIFLLAILFFIGLAIFVKQADFDMSRFGITATAVSPQKTAENGAEEKIDFDSLTPSGFKKLSVAETYIAENLYEKIDGKAPLYIESGFLKLLTQRFVSEKDESQWFELFVFDMGVMKNAFSVYSVQKRPDVDAWPAMEIAYKAGNALYFLKDKFYVELIGSAESADLFKAMAELAGKLSSQLSAGELSQIPELALFPPDNIVQGSAKLYLSNVFGFDGFRDTFVCQYRLGEEFITAFLSKCSSRQDAQTVAGSYYKFLIENGAKDKPASEKGLAAIKSRVLDFYNTTEIIFVVGPYVVGIHEAEDQQLAEKISIQLINKLSDAVKTTKE